MTHTLALLTVTKKTYKEIYKALKKAGYAHAFLEDGTIDMTHIAIERAGKPKKKKPPIQGAVATSGEDAPKKKRGKSNGTEMAKANLKKARDKLIKPQEDD